MTKKGMQKSATGILRALLSVALICASTVVTARDLTIGVLFDPSDERYEWRRLDKSYPGHPLGRPKAGAELAIKESQFQLSQAKLNVSLQEMPADSVQSAREQIDAMVGKGVHHFLLDLPGSTIAELTRVLHHPEAILFNVSAQESVLRRAACAENLFHTMPDETMMADAIAQFLTAHKWNRVLLLSSMRVEDGSVVAAVQSAVRRYGLKLVANRPFKLSNNPRERDLGNVALLTAGIDADVIWVVDGDGEFARSVPYRTVLPRPVVGSAGLVAEGWHASWERYGAPQLNRRFKKAEGRPMAAADWAAWMATKSIIEVALKLPESRKHRKALRDPRLVLDGFKGARLSFRPWDQQLRQPIFLAHGGIGGGIAGAAPFDGFLHQKNNLDTLGADEKESPCRLKEAL
jgi:ABC transporter substrate binding protein (PQQ-dependent alcohol dehydrogenase system)